MIIYKVRW